jgi:hypothetical protein
MWRCWHSWPEALDETSARRHPRVATTLPLAGPPLARLLDPGNDQDVFDTTQAGQIDVAFDQPFTLRSVTVRTPSPWGYSPGVYRAANSLRVEASEDGVTFRAVGTLEYPQHGWQTDLTTLTHALPETTARVFRFVRAAGARPLFRELRFRAGRAPAPVQPGAFIPAGNPPDRGQDGGAMVDQPPHRCARCARCGLRRSGPRARSDRPAGGRWHARLVPPPGRWRILRLGHTSNGRENSAGGAQGWKSIASTRRR